jgi:Ala-tRNA(Pro) deacylase
MAIDSRLQRLLDDEGVGYEIIHHVADRHALRAALDTRTPPREFAKVVLVHVDDRFALAVLPATHHLAPSRLARSIGARIVWLAAESEVRGALPDYEVGAAPPFAPLCDLPVYVSPLLAAGKSITFNAGNHSDALRMVWEDYERLAKPEVVHLSHHEEEQRDGGSA